jgi:hypothetical protein
MQLNRYDCVLFTFLDRFVPIFVMLFFLTASCSRADEVIRVGVIGCDTSHAVKFSELINDPNAKGAAADCRVVVAYPGGSPDIASSQDRVAGFTETLRESGVEIVDTIEELKLKCDVVLLESVDGRVHLEQFRKVADGRAVFIDKPVAASLADVLAIRALAEETGTPCFTSSALRFGEEVARLQSDRDSQDLIGAVVASPYKVEPTHSDFYWYGVHGVESLFALVGEGCESVTCTENPSAVVAVGTWADGRFGVYNGLKKSNDYSYTLYGLRGTTQEQGFSGYDGLIEEICQFFKTKQPPVTWDQTQQVFAFMEAAAVSKRSDGKVVKLRQVIDDARRESQGNNN